MEASSQRRGGRPVAGPVGDSARLLVVGDSHGNEFFLARAAKWAAKLDCELIVQLGDFGFWPDQRVKRNEGRAVINDRWLNAVARHLTQSDRNQRMLVLDGNHDAHPLLRASYDAPDAHGFRPIRDGVLTHAERGAVWVWCGLRFGALGGAISIDRSMRRSGWEWWESEAITQAELHLLVERARQVGGLDVLFTHDAPSGIDIPLVRPMTDVVLRRDLDQSRWMVRSAVEALRPRLLIHGHYHVRYQAELVTTDGVAVAVHGLAHDERGFPGGGAWVVLEIDRDRTLRIFDQHRPDAEPFESDAITPSMGT